MKWRYSANQTYSHLDQRLKSNRRPSKNVQYQVQVVAKNQQPLGSPRNFGGIIADINTANIAPIDPNPQNAQLFYYCESCLASSIEMKANRIQQISSG
jgi:hypothetical protein